MIKIEIVESYSRTDHVMRSAPLCQTSFISRLCTLCGNADI